MIHAASVRREAEKISPESGRFIHCYSGWVYKADPDTKEDEVVPCWMCPEGRAIEAGPR